MDLLSHVTGGYEEIEGGYPTLLTPGNLRLRKPVSGIEQDIPMEYLKALIKRNMFEYGGKNETIGDVTYLVEAKTGSGKSTTMPVELYRILKHSDGAGIIITQPKVLTAQDIPSNQISEQPWARDMVLGKNLGYKTGPLKQGTTERSSLIYATVGSVNRMICCMTDDEFMSKVRIIILDEVHQRDIELDIVIMYLKRLLLRNVGNKRCPIVIMTSATFDVDTYSKFFCTPEENILSITGTVFDIQRNFLPNPTTDYIATITDTVEYICKLPLPQKVNGVEVLGNDILIFLPGADFRLPAKLSRLNAKLQQEKLQLFVVLTLNSQVVSGEGLHLRLINEEYNNIKLDDKFEYSPGGKLPVNRRVIISTSVAETGLTLDNLGYVIDAGFDKKSESYPPFNVSALTTKPATRPNVVQRIGRVGRKYPGIFFGMYTEKTFNDLISTKPPAIVTDSTELLLLRVIAENEDFDIENIDMIDPPPLDSLRQALEVCLVLGYAKIQPKLSITPLGKLFSTTKINPYWFKAIVSAYSHDVYIQDIINIASISMYRKSDYTSKSINIYQEMKDMSIEVPFKSIEQFKLLTMDDFIEELYIFILFEKMVETLSPNEVIKKCRNLGISFSGMMDIVNTNIEITEEIANLGYNPISNKEYKLIDSLPSQYIQRVSNIKTCMYIAFILNVITLEDNKYKTRFGLEVKTSTSVPCVDNVLSEELEMEKPKYIITNDISLDENKKSETYNFLIKAKRVAVLDGYVDIDRSLLLPIE